MKLFKRGASDPFGAAPAVTAFPWQTLWCSLVLTVMVSLPAAAQRFVSWCVCFLIHCGYAHDEVKLTKAAVATPVDRADTEHTLVHVEG